MRATLLLCDYAVEANGKLFIAGGGWSVAGPGPIGGYIALLLGVPWDRANHRLDFTLALLDDDGSAVSKANEVGTDVPITISAVVEVGRPAGLHRGVSLDVPLAIELPKLVLAPGRRYEWVLTIENESRDDWHLPFTVRTST